MKYRKLKYFLLLVLISVALVSCSGNENKVEVNDIEIIIPWTEDTLEDKVGNKMANLLKEELEKDGENIEVSISNIKGLSGVLGTQEFLSKDEGVNKILINNEAAAFYNITGMADISLEDIDIYKMLVSDVDVLLAKEDDRFQTLESLLIQIKENPNKISMGYSGVGTNSNIYLNAFIQEGYKVGKKAFDSQAEVITALNNGEIDFAVINKSLANEYLRLQDNSNIQLLAYFLDEDLPLEGAENIVKRVAEMDKYISKYNPVYMAIGDIENEEEYNYIASKIDVVLESEAWKEFIELEGLQDLTKMTDEEIQDYWMNYIKNRQDIISK